jgi:hypothetical protein
VFLHNFLLATPFSRDVKQLPFTKDLRIFKKTLVEKSRTPIQTPVMKDMDIWHVEYLQIIQHFVIQYWNDYGRLPNSLKAALEDALRKLHANPTPQQVALFQIPREPGTGVSYEYKITGNDSFELSANIEQNLRAMHRMGVSSGWKRRALHLCFSCAIVQD